MAINNRKIEDKIFNNIDNKNIELNILQYREAILEMLGKEKEVDSIFINESLPGIISIEELIKKIKIINNKVNLFLFLEKEDINKKNKLNKLGINNIYLIKKIKKKNIINLLNNNLIKNKKIDILILDVEFKNNSLDGIEFAKKLRKFNKEFYLIFLSAHQRFLYPALVTKIFDYLIKPVNMDMISDLVSRIKEEFSDDNNMFIKINKWYSIKSDEIIYMEKSINKTNIITTKGVVSCTKTL